MGRYIQAVLTALILLSTNLIYSHRKPFLKRIHALTVRKLNTLPRGYAVNSIANLVKAIHVNNEVPRRTILSAHDSLFEFVQGISISRSDHTVFIFSRGYAKTTEPGTNDNFIQKGAAAKAAHIQFDDQIVPAHFPLVSFDYDDGRDGFAFGQAGEVNTLKQVYDAVLAANPHTRIVLIGDCRGAKVALEFATQNPQNLAAMILMAPFISGKELTDNIARANLSFPLRRHILHNFFLLYFRRYKAKNDNLEQRLHQIDPTIPILIAHRRSDQLVSMSTINTLIRRLRNTGNKKLELIITNDAREPHSKLTGISEIQQKIAQFIDQHVALSNLPF